MELDGMCVVHRALLVTDLKVTSILPRVRTVHGALGVGTIVHVSPSRPSPARVDQERGELVSIAERTAILT